MHGDNKIRKQNLDQLGKLWIQEIFKTVQGEGHNTGTPSIFVRLAGCNLQCEFCDTEFESAFEDEVNYKTVQDILSVILTEVGDTSITNIVLTGGEPFRQDIAPLIAWLLKLGYSVEIETAGTLWLETLDPLIKHIHITVSPKTGKVNPNFSWAAGSWKYVISEDNHNKNSFPIYKMNKETGLQQRALASPLNNAPIYLQPMDVEEPFFRVRNIKATLALAYNTGYKISVQTHKYIGVR